MGRAAACLATVLMAYAPIKPASASNSMQQESVHQHDDHEHAGAAEAMSGHRHETDPQIKLTPTRPSRPGDRERADAVLRTLSDLLPPYRDSAQAERDGYKPFLEALPLREHHFTNWRYGFLGAFRFDPEKPTSLLYRRTAQGYTLAGAMYTAPARATEDELDNRIPLSIARWHMHVNICLPSKGEREPAWKRFGFQGTITSEAACRTAGGRFHPQIFGWMVHVYPFERDPSQVWVH